jgi:hypothetical protein
MALSMKTLSMTLRIRTLSIMTLSIMTLSLMRVSTKRLNIMTYNDTQHYIRVTLGANVIKLFTMVIYCHSMEFM